MNKELVKYPFELMAHPFNGFWDLKYDRSRKTNLVISFIILGLMVLTNVLSTQYSGFLVSMYNPNYMNSLLEVLYVLIPVIFWTVANWSITTLMDGEGKFVEIFTSTCFAMLPLVIINLPWIWLSNYISLQEASFYYFSGSLATIWFIFLLFVGNMTVQQFTPGKTIVTILLTVAAMAFMAFLCLLFFSLVQQIINFSMTIYQEIVLRS
ncbi:YIP1 family protein [Paenibacillus typhae]|uniref:Yip1 domain-containing protein n=1 Tax=Paenibacillus typhae TaxID=1174501 RepID=A0A1G8FFU4_9BACL|nr:YIP1 family protein [Paenibacillus typhae]SDH81021.1 Yip1 domain-containing protein [Paenibacillus typhae]